MNPHTSQASNASKADQDSPFALLMAASAPKEDEPVRAQEDAQKPANDPASAQPVKPQTRAESKPKAKAEEKAKPDENKTADDDGQDRPEDVTVANDNSAPATESKTVTADPVSPPQPIAPVIVIADTAAPEKPVSETAATVVAASQPATPPLQDLAGLTAGQAAAHGAASQTQPEAAMQAAAQTQASPQVPPQQTGAPPAPVSQTQESQTPSQQTSTQQTSTQQLQGQQASLPQAPVSGMPQVQPAAPQPSVQPVTEQPADTAQSIQTTPAKETLVQIATLQKPAAKPAETGEQTDSGAPESADLKTDLAKPVTRDIPAPHADNKEAKADTPRPEIAKTDSVKPDMAQPATVETAAPKSAPQVQAPPNTNIASVATNTATQNLQAPATLPGIPQHVQVSAQTAQPNMPALAVEIAAKSQSGAKQFDIRLDPPELGRVEVRLSIDAAGKASAHLSADQPQTLDLLQKDASSLTRALRDAGLNVSQDGLNFSLRQQSHDASAQQGQGQGQGQGRHASRGVNLVATNSIDATQNSATWRGDGRLDIRV